MSPIRIGYVPEHFSTPLYIARDNGFFKDNKVDVELVCCPGKYDCGTGEMTQKLKDKELDIAIALTEGLVAGISKGQDWYKIVGTYVDAPLCWAISTGAESKHRSIDTLFKSDAAISRLGSGSHIMAYVLADQQGWLNGKTPGEPFDFTVLNNFKAMRDAVNDLSSDFFMWETFTTKPYHDSGEVKRIGQITPPWPAFLFAAHTDLLESNAEGIKQAILAIQRATVLFMEQKDNESVKRIMSLLDYPEQDVRSWFKTVRYAKDPTLVSRQAIQVTVSTLIKAGVIERPGPAPEDVCDLKVAHLGE